MLTDARRTLALGLLFAMLTSGCAALNLFNLRGEKFQSADRQNPATEILAIWQATDGPGLKGVPTRGFSGQIYFFTQGVSAPVKVEGKVRVYVFDDRGTVAEQGKPIHEFDFEPAAWAAHFQNSNLGAAYGLFIPYTREDYHQAICSLRVRFVPKAGPTVYSPMSTIVLPGPPLRAAANETPPVTQNPSNRDPHPSGSPSLQGPAAPRSAASAASAVTPIATSKSEPRIPEALSPPQSAPLDSSSLQKPAAHPSSHIRLVSAQSSASDSAQAPEQQDAPEQQADGGGDGASADPTPDVRHSE
jgi:hypothetical protein